MMGSSNLMMGLTLVLVVCLAVVLGLVLILLAELYCSILLRRRHTTTTAAAATVDPTTNPPPPSLPNLYTQSILTAPRNILYPTVAGAGTGTGDDIEKQQPPENEENNQDLDHLMYISNPMYDGDENGRKSRVAGNTPFETPDSSPSRLESPETSSGDDDDGGEKGEEITSGKMGVTPPLTPMKKLPATVGDGGGGGGDVDENSNNGVSSSSSSGTPCTSLSW